MAYQRPDIYVEETLIRGVGNGGPVQPVGAFIGLSWKGPTAPTLVSSWSDYVKKFGGFPNATQATLTNYLPWAVNSYFANGGGDCYIARVLHTDALASSVALDDRAGSPVTTLTVDAISAGTWGDDLYAKISDRDAATGRFDLHILYGGTDDSKIVERWNDVTMDSTSDRYVVSVVNSTSRGSAYVTLTDNGSVTAAPDNTPALGTFQLASGADGTTPDNNDTTDTIDAFDVVTIPMVLNVVGQSNASVVNAALQYAEGRRDTFVVVDPPSNTSANDVISYATTLTETSFGAVYYPWVKVLDASVNRAGVVKTIPAGGAVVGNYIATDRARGPHKTPAGLSTRVVGAYDTELRLTNDELDALNVGNVNALRTTNTATGVVIMGGRTLKKSGPDQYLSVRRSLIYLRDSLTRLTEFAIFEPNDQALWAQVEARCGDFLRKFYNKGGLRGDSPNQAYFVKCDSETNPLNTVEAGELHLEVGVALQYPTEFVIIKLGQWEGGSDAQEVF